MRCIDEARIFASASKASQIAALCRFLSEALGADPDTATASEAVDGLQAMATMLADELQTMAEATA
jgi:hypothetical protein